MEIQIKKQLGVKIHNSTLLYVGRTIGNISTKEFWNMRGLDGHSRDVEKNMQLQQQAIAAVNTPEGQKFLREFIDEVLKVFDLLTHPDMTHIRQYLGNQQFVFITGIMRSGGTYLLSEMSKIHDIPLDELDMAMVHDRIPQYDFFYYSYQPHQLIRLLFDLAQFLVWVKRELSDAPVVIKKHQTLAFALPVISRIFGKNSLYIKTLRHPISAANSAAQLDGIDVSSTQWPAFYSNWEEMLLPRCSKLWAEHTFYEKFLMYYEKLYTEFSHNSIGIENQVVPISFGSQFEQFLKEYSRDRKPEYVPGKFNASLKIFSEKPMEEAEHALTKVKNYWELSGLKFPAMDVF